METLAIATDYGLVRSTVYTTLIRDLGGGYEQRETKAPSGGLRRFKLVFRSRLSSVMEADLYDFYCDRKGRGEAFYLTDPFNPLATITVRFDQELEEEMFYDLLEHGEITLVEVMG